MQKKSLMKAFLFTSFFLVQSLLFAQLKENTALVHLKYSVGKIDTAFYQNLAPSVEVMLGKRLGLNYNFDLIYRNDNIFQMHSSPGLIITPLFIKSYFTLFNSNEQDDYEGFDLLMDYGFLFFIVNIFGVVLPEGISYHFPLKEKWDVAPYINALSIDYVKNRNLDEHYLLYSFNFGAKASWYNTNGLTFTTFLESRKTWGMGWGFGGGIGLGYSFNYLD